MTRLLGAVLLALLLSLGLVACGSDGGSDEGSSGESSGGTDGSEGETTGERIEVDGDEALTWGDGSDYGVVLAHGAAFDAASWEDQATAIADQGATVVAVESIEPEAIGNAIDYLGDEGLDNVAFVGGSAGADGGLDYISENPDSVGLIITLAANSVVEGLGEAPKLFIVSEGDPVADVSAELAETASGQDNEVVMLPGDAHAQNIFDTDQADAALETILERLGS